MEIVFHPDAAKRFNDLADKLRERVRVVRKTAMGHTTSYAPYPAAKFEQGDVIGPITTTDHIVDRLGNEVGRLWVVGDVTVGLLEDGYEDVTKLAKAFEKTPCLRDRVGIQFLVDEICSWLKTALEQGPHQPLVAHVSTRCANAIRDYEIWVPLFRVHGRNEFSLGEVNFRNISSAIIESFFDERGKPLLTDAARQALQRHRSQLQDHLAACVRLTAEKNTAQAIGRSKAEEAIALLRFLSPANWVLGMQSYCVPLGRERIEIPVELFVKNGELIEISKTTLERGPTFWDVDQEGTRFPGVLGRLHAISSSRATDFRRQLYDALLLYSRNSTVSEISDKLVFVVVSLESMLLRDANEPITKNIGERMAFLIGTSVEEREAIIQNVDAAYRIRSKFIHHGNSVEDSEVIERFFEYAWQCFHAMLQHIENVDTKAALIQALERRKLSGDKL